MPYERPTLTRLIEQAQTDVASSLGLFALLRYSVERSFAVALAGLAQGLYGFLDWISRQSVPFTATGEYRAAWAALRGVYQKGESTAGGYASFPATDGQVLPIGTPVTAAATGARFLTTAGALAAGGVVTAPIEAVDPGPAGNLAAGTVLVLGTAIAGINGTGQAAGALTGGAGVEGDDDFRDRMLAAYAEPPQGGALADYVRWALEVPGVTRAWAIPFGSGPGTISVYAMLDDANAGSGGFPVGTDGGATDEARTTPATGDQLTIADHIFEVQPVTALVRAYAPAPYPVAFSIGNLPDESLRAPILEALTDVMRQKGVVSGTMYPSDFTSALDAIPGLTRYSMPIPSGPVTSDPGTLHQRGTVTWI